MSDLKGTTPIRQLPPGTKGRLYLVEGRQRFRSADGAIDVEVRNCDYTVFLAATTALTSMEDERAYVLESGSHCAVLGTAFGDFPALRQYDRAKGELEFIDYDFPETGLEIEIADSDLWLWDDGELYLDFSPQTLGQR